MIDNFENFYKLCLVTGVVKQLEQAGFLTDENTLSNLGAEQILKVYDVEITIGEKFKEKFSKKNIGIAGKLGDKSAVINKLKRFKLQYGYNDETILKAVDLYLQENRLKPQFIMKADYFIFKRDGFKSEERSELSVWCEMVDQEDIKIRSMFNES